METMDWKYLLATIISIVTGGTIWQFYLAKSKARKNNADAYATRIDADMNLASKAMEMVDKLEKRLASVQKELDDLRIKYNELKLENYKLKTRVSDIERENGHG